MKKSPSQVVAETLRKGESVHLELAPWGQLHIDRQLPFLCVHRCPAGRDDTGTRQLLTSQAAYLLADSGAQYQDQISALTHDIATQQGKAFGAFLVLEIWAAATAPDKPIKHAFRIIAPRRHPPDTLLETLENTLLQVSAHRKTPEIGIVYRDVVKPPGLPSLLKPEQLENIRCLCLGLEINPVYRHPETGELYHFLHQALRRRLNRALKRSFYLFAHEYTTHRPAHFHELGPHAITGVVQKVDDKLAEISAGFDLLLHVSPVNSENAWKAFRERKFVREVEFLYRPRTIEPALLKRHLFRIPIETIEDPTLAYIFSAKRDELDRHISLIADRNTPRFLLGSRQLFGDVEPELLSQACSLLATLVPEETSGLDVDLLNASQFASHAEQELSYYRKQDPRLASRVELRGDVPGIMVSKGNFLIGNGAKVEPARLRAVLAHEIGTHILTWHNGRQQPFRNLYTGMAGYESLQEGLAVLSEYLVGGLGPDRLRQLAGRVLAVHSITDGANFIETFRLLHDRYDFQAKAAFMMTMRTYRGGGYTKDAVYLRGLVQLLKHLSQGHSIEELYLGKITHEHLPLIEELRWRHILQAPRLLPRSLDRPEAKKRLRKLASGINLQQLVAEGY